VDPLHNPSSRRRRAHPSGTFGCGWLSTAVSSDCSPAAAMSPLITSLMSIPVDGNPAISRPRPSPGDFLHRQSHCTEPVETMHRLQLPLPLLLRVFAQPSPPQIPACTVDASSVWTLALQIRGGIARVIHVEVDEGATRSISRKFHRISEDA
jgi:hypothetical protein